MLLACCDPYRDLLDEGCTSGMLSAKIRRSTSPVCVHIYIYIYERKREREREISKRVRDKDFFLSSDRDSAVSLSQ